MAGAEGVLAGLRGTTRWVWNWQGWLQGGFRVGVLAVELGVSHFNRGCRAAKQPENEDSSRGS